VYVCRETEESHEHVDDAVSAILENGNQTHVRILSVIRM